MPERLDRVHVQLARRREPFELPWDSRDKLLNEIRQRESAQPIVDAFENAGASRPVTFTLEQKAQLFDLLEAWANRVSISELPAVVWDLRCSLADDLHDAAERDK